MSTKIRWPFVVALVLLLAVGAFFAWDAMFTDPCTDYGPNEFRSSVDKCGNWLSDL